MVKAYLLCEKDACINELLVDKTNAFFKENKIEFVLCTLDKSEKINEEDIVIIFFYLENREDIKKAKELKESLNCNCIVFISENESLVFETLGIQPISFIRKDKLQEDLNSGLNAIKEHLNNVNLTLTFKMATTNLRLNQKSIIYIESYGHYLTIHAVSGLYRVREKLINVLEKTNNKFVRVHKSYVVNKEFIRKIAANNITLKDGENIPLGRAYKENLN